MKVALVAAVLLGIANSALGDPRAERSQHPRIGALAEINFASDSASLWSANRKLGRVAAWAAAGHVHR